MKKVIISILIVILFFGLILGFFYGFRRLYPLEYKEAILEYSREFNLSPTLVASIINTESSFNRNAESKAGAKGLMQLKIETAKEIALKLNVENFQDGNIFDENLNIRFGCFYLRYLLDYYNGDLTLSLCSYNAGMGTVNEWISNEQYFENGNLKKIPYKETENYLVKVKNGEKIYRYLYGIS